MRGLTQLQGRPKATATVAYMIGCWLYVSDKGGDKEEMECATRHQNHAIRKDRVFVLANSSDKGEKWEGDESGGILPVHMPWEILTARYHGDRSGRCELRPVNGGHE